MVFAQKQLFLSPTADLLCILKRPQHILTEEHVFELKLLVAFSSPLNQFSCNCGWILCRLALMCPGPDRSFYFPLSLNTGWSFQTSGCVFLTHTKNTLLFVKSVKCRRLSRAVKLNKIQTHKFNKSQLWIFTFKGNLNSCECVYIKTNVQPWFPLIFQDIFSYKMRDWFSCCTLNTRFVFFSYSCTFDFLYLCSLFSCLFISWFQKSDLKKMSCLQQIIIL